MPAHPHTGPHRRASPLRWALLILASFALLWPESTSTHSTVDPAGSARSTATTPNWGTEPAPPELDNVEAAFARIQGRGEHLIASTAGLIPRPRYRTTLRNLFGVRNHFQGIQRLGAGNSQYVVVSGSNPGSSVAELFVVHFPPTARQGSVVSSIAVDPVMWHAGGLSTLGSTLAVPLHGGRPRHAKIVFYDVSRPDAPVRHLVEVDRPTRKASATALTRLTNGHYLLAVLSAYDGLPRRMDLYLSRGPRFDEGFLPQPVSWRVRDVRALPGQDRTFSHFQAINFVRQSDGRLFLVGFHNSITNQSVLPGRDYADLYEVLFPPETLAFDAPRLALPAIVKIANRRLRCETGFCNLDAAAGLDVDPVTQSMTVYAAPGWLSGDLMRLTVYRSSGN